MREEGDAGLGLMLDPTRSSRCRDGSLADGLGWGDWTVTLVMDLSVGSYGINVRGCNFPNLLGLASTSLKVHRSDLIWFGLYQADQLFGRVVLGRV